ncbi:UNVERIFIED_CONTAM: hypothetical protein NCL1_36015 [Trichonephila clavipes]
MYVTPNRISVMDSTLLEDRETCKNSFDVLSFEKKLVELVEELRLRRNLEAENEKNLKWLMDEKYKAELEWKITFSVAAGGLVQLFLYAIALMNQWLLVTLFQIHF